MIYDSSTIKLPNPRFVVFYNGRKHSEALSVLRLSDAYIEPEEQPYLELKTIIVNINSDKRLQLIENCPTLCQYTTFVECVHTYTVHYPLEEAINMAIDECIHNNVLSDFLTHNKAEVVKMSIYEYDEARELNLIRESERSQGLQQGKQDEQENSIQQLIILCKQLNGSKDDVIKQIVNAYSLSEKEAKDKVNKYWPSI